MTVTLLPPQTPWCILAIPHPLEILSGMISAGSGSRSSREAMLLDPHDPPSPAPAQQGTCRPLSGPLGTVAQGTQHSPPSYPGKALSHQMMCPQVTQPPVTPPLLAGSGIHPAQEGNQDVVLLSSGENLPLIPGAWQVPEGLTGQGASEAPHPDPGGLGGTERRQVPLVCPPCAPAEDTGMALARRGTKKEGLRGKPLPAGGSGPAR